MLHLVQANVTMMRHSNFSVLANDIKETDTIFNLKREKKKIFYGLLKTKYLILFSIKNHYLM